MSEIEVKTAQQEEAEEAKAEAAEAGQAAEAEAQTSEAPEAEEAAEKAAEESDQAEKTEAASGEAESTEDGDAKYLRLLAEFQNFKRRTEKEKSDLYSYANEKIITELLEVIDNFERALEQPADDAFKEGMGLIFDQLSNVLTKAGLAEIDALGEDFDPNVHNAVMTEETDEYESGKVSGVMQKGYTLNGKVIRPSMVKVVS